MTTLLFDYPLPFHPKDGQDVLTEYGDRIHAAYRPLGMCIAFTRCGAVADHYANTDGPDRPRCKRCFP